jgi:hypothetical protein
VLTVQFAHCTFRLTPQGCETVFEDGAICPATFVDDEQARASAADLGYTDVRLMHLHHELAHTLIAEACGLPYSLTLRNVVVPGTALHYERVSEEALVFSFQRWLMTGARAPELDRVPDLEKVAHRIRIITAMATDDLSGESVELRFA